MDKGAGCYKGKGHRKTCSIPDYTSCWRFPPQEPTNIHKKFPDIAHLKLGVTSFYLVTSPELVQEVLVTKQRDFIRGKYLQRTKKVFGEGLLTSEGDFHHHQRRLVQPAFHHDRINTYAKTMTEYTSRVMLGWRDKQVLDIHAEMMRLTMSIVAKCPLYRQKTN
ncbi:MAG: cytochrome P450 [Nitrososphaerota archaeon]|nr:cytochrome P450 [Nitrososphaerota archaeon]